jgi:hypothetical protein
MKTDIVRRYSHNPILTKAEIPYLCLIKTEGGKSGMALVAELPKNRSV